jgi:hypothetical protein
VKKVLHRQVDFGKIEKNKGLVALPACLASYF